MNAQPQYSAEPVKVAQREKYRAGPPGMIRDHIQPRSEKGGCREAQNREQGSNDAIERFFGVGAQRPIVEQPWQKHETHEQGEHQRVERPPPEYDVLPLLVIPGAVGVRARAYQITYRVIQFFAYSYKFFF